MPIQLPKELRSITIAGGVRHAMSAAPSPSTAEQHGHFGERKTSFPKANLCSSGGSEGITWTWDLLQGLVIPGRLWWGSNEGSRGTCPEISTQPEDIPADLGPHPGLMGEWEEVLASCTGAFWPGVSSSTRPSLEILSQVTGVCRYPAWLSDWWLHGQSGVQTLSSLFRAGLSGDS